MSQELYKEAKGDEREAVFMARMQLAGLPHASMHKTSICTLSYMHNNAVDKAVWWTLGLAYTQRDGSSFPWVYQQMALHARCPPTIPYRGVFVTPFNKDGDNVYVGVTLSCTDSHKHHVRLMFEGQKLVWMFVDFDDDQDPSSRMSMPLMMVSMSNVLGGWPKAEEMVRPEYPEATRRFLKLKLPVLMASCLPKLPRELWEGVGWEDSELGMVRDARELGVGFRELLRCEPYEPLPGDEVMSSIRDLAHRVLRAERHQAYISTRMTDLEVESAAAARALMRETGRPYTRGNNAVLYGHFRAERRLRGMGRAINPRGGEAVGAGHVFMVQQEQQHPHQRAVKAVDDWGMLEGAAFWFCCLCMLVNIVIQLYRLQ